jgi:hypothetical protein
LEEGVEIEILRLSNKMSAAAEAKGFPKASRSAYNKAMKITRVKDAEDGSDK